LRSLLPGQDEEGQNRPEAPMPSDESRPSFDLAHIPEQERIAMFRAAAGQPMVQILYQPAEDCFFSGEDPFYLVRQLPEVIWGRIDTSSPLPPLSELDPYRCVLVFEALSSARLDELRYLFRYVPDQVQLSTLPPYFLAIPTGRENGGPVYDDFVRDALAAIEANDVVALERMVRILLDLTAPDLWVSSTLRWILAMLETPPHDFAAIRLLVLGLETLTPPDWQAFTGQSRPTKAAAASSSPTVSEPICHNQQRLAVIDDDSPFALLSEDERAAMAELVRHQQELLKLAQGAVVRGGMQSVAATLTPLLSYLGYDADDLDGALERSVQKGEPSHLLEWIEGRFSPLLSLQSLTKPSDPRPSPPLAASPPAGGPQPSSQPAGPAGQEEVQPLFGRRADDKIPNILKVDQSKVDRLMNLIGEMVVAKNALPYLASMAENHYGVRELAREIKNQYGVINRIAEEMQDAIMQVRMMPMSFVFQKFPRLVRDIARKIGKEVRLELLGEETEADKNMIEVLGDPLMHIIRNSLDHGIEEPDFREAAGKPREGHLTIAARQESDRAIVEITDDGAGIDPEVIKRKAYEKGLIDEQRLESLTDAEALNLIFLPGFSTADTISEVSGRGVGMDVVKSALERIRGTVSLSSQKGEGTRIVLALPLSMAVTNVMVLETAGQLFGVPSDSVIESVRVKRSEIRRIKNRDTIVLRGEVLPLFSLNELLALHKSHQVNDDGEYAVLVVNLSGARAALIVDGFRENMDIILKPLPGALSQLGCHAGSALMGDGTVLLILNLKELI
jgi:two-component system chemotaxis sensor kinase CheA